jgi:hypothetical protein
MKKKDASSDIAPMKSFVPRIGGSTELYNHQLSSIDSTTKSLSINCIVIDNRDKERKHLLAAGRSLQSVNACSYVVTINTFYNCTLQINTLQSLKIYLYILQVAGMAK